MKLPMGLSKNALAQDDIKETGFLLDGYPRTIEQAHALDQTLSDLGFDIEGVINIEVNPECFLERLSGRFICRKLVVQLTTKYLIHQS